ncbi:MAG: helix-turn-helix domain-containing protein [Pseudomonadota bacterium]
MAQSQTITDQPILLADTEAARLLGMSRATLWRRVGEGSLPQPIRMGRLTRWRRDELLSAVEALSARRIA